MGLAPRSGLLLMQTVHRSRVLCSIKHDHLGRPTTTTTTDRTTSMQTCLVLSSVSVPGSPPEMSPAEGVIWWSVWLWALEQYLLKMEGEGKVSGGEREREKQRDA